MKNLAQMIRQRSNEAYESLLGPEEKRQWAEVMEQINRAAEQGNNNTTWHESGEYMRNWENKVQHAANENVLKKLREEGFDVFTERRAGRGLGAIIYW